MCPKQPVTYFCVTTLRHFYFLPFDSSMACRFRSQSPVSDFGIMTAVTLACDVRITFVVKNRVGKREREREEERGKRKENRMIG